MSDQTATDAESSYTIYGPGHPPHHQVEGHHPRPEIEHARTQVCFKCGFFFNPLQGAGNAPGQRMCPTCAAGSNPLHATSAPQQQSLILCPGCRSVLMRPPPPHPIAMCGQCQRILKLPEHVDAHYSPPREPPLVQTAQNLHGVRPPPGFGGPAATQLSVVACICPSCSSVVQAPLSAPICKCGNCGQPMRVPTAIA